MNSAQRTLLLRSTLVIMLGLCAGIALAQQGATTGTMTLPNINVNIGGAKGQNNVSTSLQILGLLTILSIAPAILILTTAFTRIVIVFSFLRSALGTPTIPPNQVVIGLSLFLTFYVMAPTWKTINEQALQPVLRNEKTVPEVLPKAEKAIRAFMMKSTYEKDLILFVNLRKEKPKSASDIPLTTLIPAFILSELKTAFIIGFYLFIPFVIIDLIVASSLMSMGMMMLPPAVVSLPAKLLVFVLADGWTMLVNALMAGYS